MAGWLVGGPESGSWILIVGPFALYAFEQYGIVKAKNNA
jgi:hypothetical protein